MILDKLNLRILSIIVIAIIIIISAGIYLTLNNNSDEDKEPPKIITITGDLSANQGDSVSISVTFSDNENVTKATIYYKSESSENWMNSSIISGLYEIYIPKNSNENYFYYIVIDDEAGNGPVGDPSIDGSTYYTIEVTDEFENGDDEEFIHTVFVEESTATDCKYCPYAADKLHKLYETGEYDFYYVSLVEDENSLAEQRVVTDYNRLGNPTIYIDGGYKVISGGVAPLGDYINAIGTAETRDVPKIRLNISASYDNNSNKILTNVTIKNFEENIYSGLLRVYLTEKISRWNDYNGSKYLFGFLDYVIDMDISIDSKTSKDFSESYVASDIDPENIMLIAVVFSSERNQGFSDPPDGNSFDAYYADACDGTEVVEGGNLPPEVGITYPQSGKLYLGGKSRIEKFRDIIKIIRYYVPFLNNSEKINMPIIIGKTTITAYAEDDQSVKRVEFYINNELVFNDTEAPYEYCPSQKLLFKKPIIIPRTYEIMVKAIDSQGKSSTASIKVRALRVF